LFLILLKSSYHELPVRRRSKTYPSQPSMGEGWACPEPSRRDGGDIMILHWSKRYCSHYLVWIAGSFNTNGLQHFHQKIMTTYITYTTPNDYYMPTYRRNRKTCKLRTEAENWDPVITSTNEFQQVMPFSLFHRASTAPQTQKRQALRVTLTHRNKPETAYQVMRDIAGSLSPHSPIDQ
jgi:hypothetical protein